MSYDQVGRWLLLAILCASLELAFPCQEARLIPFWESRYGSSANLVLTTGHGVNGYTLDNALGEFILTHPDVRALFFAMRRLSYRDPSFFRLRFPPRGKIYSCKFKLTPSSAGNVTSS